jgi:hypothetical protein
MADRQQSASSFGPEGDDAFGDSSFQDGSGPLDGGGANAANWSSLAGQASFATEVARQWVKEHQKEAMVGAFAAGVFFGSWFRS